MTKRERLGWALAAVAALAVSGGTLVAVRAAEGVRSVFVPISPCRLLDTRPAPDNVGPRTTPIGPGEDLTVQVHGANGNCSIPASATAIVMNTTAVNPTVGSFLTIYPADVVRPLAANLNTVAGGFPTPNLVTVQLSGGGAIKIFNLAGTVDVVGDITGYYAPEGASGTGPKGDTGATGPVGPAGPAGPQFGRRIVSSLVVDATGNFTGDSSTAMIGVDGAPIIGHYDQSAGDLRVTHCSSPACDTSTSTSLDTVEFFFSQDVPARLGSDGIPVFAYQSSTSTLRVFRCTTRLCTAGTGATADPITTADQDIDLAIGSDGMPVLAQNNTGPADDALRVTKCNDLACAGGNETSNDIDSVASQNVGGEVSITIGTDGNPVMAHVVSPSGGLRVTKCDDLACAGAGQTSTNVTTTPGGSVRNPFIVVGVDGNPVITYWDQNLLKVRVVRCNDPACEGNDETLSTVGDTDLGAAEPSSVIGPDGNLVIAYRHSGFQDLIVVFCNDPACSPNVGGTEELLRVVSPETDGIEPSVTIGNDGGVVVTDRSSTDLRVTHIVQQAWAPNNWGR